VRGDVEELRRLAARCVAAGRRIGAAGDDKPYRPHLTVARPRRPPLDVSEVVEALADHDGPPWVAHEIRLVRSHLGALVWHECLAAAPLGGARAT
jgi:2'-5' RNA ligase